MTLRPLHGKVLVRRQTEAISVDGSTAAKATASGLWLPTDAKVQRDTVAHGEIASGAFRGLRVMYNKYAAVRIDDTLDLVRESDLVAQSSLNPMRAPGWWPLNDYLLLLPLPWLETQTDAGLLLPEVTRDRIAQGTGESLDAYDANFGLVLAYGPQSASTQETVAGDVVVFRYRQAVYAELPYAGQVREHVFVRDRQQGLAVLAVIPREVAADVLGEEALMLVANYTEKH